jgi:hypothetical protein
LAIGYWLLAIGYWLLAIGYWLLAVFITAQKNVQLIYTLIKKIITTFKIQKTNNVIKHKTTKTFIANMLNI